MTNIFKNENSLKKNLNNKTNIKNITLSNLKISHRIFDTVNISFIILIFILSQFTIDDLTILKSLNKRHKF